LGVEIGNGVVESGDSCVSRSMCVWRAGTARRRTHWVRRGLVGVRGAGREEVYDGLLKYEGRRNSCFFLEWIDCNVRDMACVRIRLFG